MNFHDTAGITGAWIDSKSRGARLAKALSPKWVHRAQHRGLAVGLGAATRLLHRALEPDLALPPLSAVRALAARFDRLLERDFQNAERGIYPQSLLFQFPYSTYARTLPEVARELPRLVQRRRSGRTRDVPSDSSFSYPPYYLQSFHWQGDGWLSERSARLYDFSVELLFGGTADVMRRMAIEPVLSQLGRWETNPRIVDLGCGTGRYLLQLARALERMHPGVSLVGVDLSKFYLDYARELFANERGHAPRAPRPTFVEANAEATSLPDASCRVITSVFLLHELPLDARTHVIQEAYRLLEPGGRLVLLDAAQPFESAEIAHFLDAFHRIYHEPYFRSYLRSDLAAMVAGAGFTGVRVEPHFVAKLVVAEKPVS